MDNEIYVINNANDLITLEKQFKDFRISNPEQQLKFTFIDLSQMDYALDWTFHLEENNNKLTVNYFCLNQNHFKKTIKLTAIHNVEHTYSYLMFHGISFHHAFTNLGLCSKNNIKPLANIYSEQEIKNVIMDESVFSGIPQIDVANNSFTSAHKLLVGTVNKEEMFYLDALGIANSLNILLKTLYKSFIMEKKGDNLSIDIWREIENASTKKL